MGIQSNEPKKIFVNSPLSTGSCRGEQPRSLGYLKKKLKLFISVSAGFTLETAHIVAHF
ncbi:uncharacterized protein PHALS_12343 [Plasmopara halstedii]|uniref:Uncharacterized protein n=1 Tax=Plasmopara halstedii TaxID=4781 RepID=A0A0P1AL57_PLAHL|nr:uncharacterized protein PHALS_12343 [Plasmopara halstedii]CEG42037.1 hypothetical protein PHALS_12343 [Plasmopara halstedii]|eukprot:XP_024578406.1 hypothetical protein PHALS_12343 [Plasmopara halstedii]